jgi:hypothetical protein
MYTRFQNWIIYIYKMDRSSEKWSSTAQSQGGEEYPTYNEKKQG